MTERKLKIDSYLCRCLQPDQFPKYSLIYQLPPSTLCRKRQGVAIHAKEDVLLLSPTGSGKTLAFLLPIAELLQQEEGKVQCLILTPSRELAIQIEQVWKKMGTGFKVSCCYGGHDMQTEIQNLAEPPALLVGTPGRIADHIKRITFSSDALTTLVLDEFDKSLALGLKKRWYISSVH